MTSPSRIAFTLTLSESMPPSYSDPPTTGAHMTSRDVTFLGLGALAFPIGYHLAFRIAGRHVLSVITKEFA